MIKIEKSKDNYCNVCNDNKKENYYSIKFFNRLNQGQMVGLCEDCKNILILKLLKEVKEND